MQTILENFDRLNSVVTESPEITPELWDEIAEKKAEYVEMMGMEDEEAQDQAAEDFGVDPDELRSWLDLVYDEDSVQEASSGTETSYMIIAPDDQILGQTESKDEVKSLVKKAKKYWTQRNEVDTGDMISIYRVQNELPPSDMTDIRDVSKWNQDQADNFAQNSKLLKQISLEKNVSEAAPDSMLAKRINQAYGTMADMGDSGLDYLDDHAPLYDQLMEKHRYDLSRIIAKEKPQVLMKLAKEMEDVVDAAGFEMESIEESKPDFLDLDKDGDKKEPMKKAAKDAKEKDDEEVEESADQIDEAIMVSAEGDEAESLLQILKLSGMPAPAIPAAEPEMDMEPEIDMQDEYANSPDEIEMDIDAAIADGDDLNRSKQSFPDAEDGDNPMAAFESKLQQIMREMEESEKQ